VQTPPPFQITVHKFGVWRAILTSIVALIFATLLTWSISLGSVWSGVFSTLALVLSLAAWRSLARVQAFSLRWDTQVWALGEAQTRGHEPYMGQLIVTLDLGFWMLLKFSPYDAHARTRWLAVQHAGHERWWHALRTTVYGVN
jgi:hypothetical protein